MCYLDNPRLKKKIVGLCTVKGLLVQEKHGN